MSFVVGQTVGPYRIVEQLGSGGMATVFKAYHAALDRYVAIKVLHPAFKEDPNFLARFQREARVVAKLEHLNIVPVHDFSDQGGQPYLVMRYVEGETLKARLARGPLSMADTLRVVHAVGAALAYAHGQGVLHRDIKPSNVMLTPKGDAFLTDFGLARIAQAGESTLSQDSMLGTPQYISPEQAMGDPNLDARTDVYSLGVVVYELLVGRVPYQADTPYAVVHDHIYTPLPLPRSINAKLPEPLERFLLKALSKERADRYPSIEAMLQALTRAVEETDLESPGSVSTMVQAAAVPTLKAAQVIPPPAPAAAARGTPPSDARSAPAARKPANPLIWIGLGALIVAAVLVVFLLTRPQPTPATPPNKNPLPAGTAAPGGDLQDVGQAARQAFQEAGELFRKGNEQAVQAHSEEARAAFTQAAERAEQALGALAAPGTLAESELRVLAAESWLASGHPDRAEPHLTWLVKSAQEKARPLSGLALSHLLQNRVEDSLNRVEQALEIDPDLAEAHAIKACGLLKSGDRVAALREFRLAGSDKPGPELVPPWVTLVLERLECRPER
jgi:tetratricopeptide (TPR) repeat protein